MRIARQAICAILAVTLAAAGGAPSWSGSLQISTTTLDVAAPGMATSMQLRNTGPAPITVQIRAYEWAQAAGSERLSETNRIIASPPFANIAPGHEFTVRVVRTTARADHVEDSFRLLVDEVPTRPTSDRLGIRFAVRYSLPVFFSPAGARSSPLTWKASASRDEIRLTAVNNGARRSRLSALRLVGADGRTVAERPGLFGYVLGNSSMSWSFRASKHDAARSDMTLQASTENGPIHVPIRLARDR